MGHSTNTAAPTPPESTSWWTTDFDTHLPDAQRRMRTEQPRKGTAAYFLDLEAQEERENLGLPSTRTKAPSGLLVTR